MNTEWTDLPTMADVAHAQVEGWEIEVRGTAGGWYFWHACNWSNAVSYRGRPKQPKMKKVKMLCWFDGYDLLWRRENHECPDTWIRIPAEDKEIEVPDE